MGVAPTLGQQVGRGAADPQDPSRLLHRQKIGKLLQSHLSHLHTGPSPQPPPYRAVTPTPNLEPPRHRRQVHTRGRTNHPATPERGTPLRATGVRTVRNTLQGRLDVSSRDDSCPTSPRDQDPERNNRRSPERVDSAREVVATRPIRDPVIHTGPLTQIRGGVIPRRRHRPPLQSGRRSIPARLEALPGGGTPRSLLTSCDHDALVTGGNRYGRPPPLRLGSQAPFRPLPGLVLEPGDAPHRYPDLPDQGRSPGVAHHGRGGRPRARGSHLQREPCCSPSTPPDGWQDGGTCVLELWSCMPICCTITSSPPSAPRRSLAYRPPGSAPGMASSRRSTRRSPPRPTGWFDPSSVLRLRTAGSWSTRARSNERRPSTPGNARSRRSPR